ncbi:hypothetical protein HanIR_Chr03g0108551 [Helianthus annuus]|nr:hypothetical protein HanIR_Chr03g0108551 [Helianthus annuus]
MQLGDETSLHLFTGCYYSDEIWSRIQRWCRMAPMYAFEVSDLLKMTDLQTIAKHDRYILKGIVITTMWALWNERNNRSFEGKSRRPIEVVEIIKTTSYFWIRNRSKIKNIDWNVWCNFPLNLNVKSF